MSFGRIFKFFSLAFFTIALLVLIGSLIKANANTFCSDTSLNEACVWWFQCNSPNYEDTSGRAYCTCAGCPVITIPRICCASPTNNLSCSGTAGGYCSNSIRCATDYTWAQSDFECTITCCRPLDCVGDLAGSCPNVGHNCASNSTYTYTDNAVNNSCSGATQEGLCCVSKQNCNGGLKNSGSCQANVPTNTCGNYSGTQARIYSTYVHPNCGVAGTSGNGYTCTPSTACYQVSGPSTGCTTGFINNCSSNYTCSNGNTCVTNIYVHVYTDWEHDGIKNNGDVGKAGVTVSDHGGNTPTTDSTGSVTFTGKATGTYTISITVPSGYAGVGAISKSVSLTNTSGNATVDFFITPLYKISGNVYNDKNKNLKYDGTDTLYTSSTTVHLSGGPTTVSDMNQVDGTYDTGQVLESGTYTVSQTHALANGYVYTTPSTWAVTVGDPAGGKTICDSGSSLDASCTNPNNGSVANLNFGVTNENPWGQSVCFDVRDDSGSYTDPIPAAPSCGGVSGAYNSITNADCSTGAGIIFTCDATPDFGLGSANANAWQSGGAGTQQECFSGAGLNVIRTSYNYLLTTARESGIVPTDLSTICTLNGCILPSNLSKGVYIAHGDVHLNAYTFPVSATQPQGFIFLIDGNLYIQGNILVPAGSVAAFSTSGSTYVNASVGNIVTNTSDPAVNNPNIEGLYSADADFIIQSNGSAGNYCNADGTPKDKKLNVVGSIITNAAQNGGALINNRDLCIYDLDCSSVSYGDGQNGNEGLGLSYILTLFADGKFLNHKLFNWQELKP